MPVSLRPLLLLSIASLLSCQAAPVGPTAPGGPTGPVVPLSGITVLPNLDSGVLVIPEVAGAKDYRAFVITSTTKVTVGADGTERVEGATIFCAGFRQQNGAGSGKPEAMKTIEVANITGRVDVIVEALDRPCPFPGVRGTQHFDVPYGATMPGTWPIVTEDEIRAGYGSLIVNGQGPGPGLGRPAANDPPRILAQGRVEMAPLVGAAPRTSTFFDDFSTPDQPTFISKLPDATDGRQGFLGRLFQNKKWNFYMWLTEAAAQVFIDRGQLHTVLLDWQTDPFATIVSMPRAPVHLSSTGYLHITYEVASNATGRRYWWISVCGPATAGATMDGNGRLLTSLIQTPFFYNPDGRNPTLAQWNCFQMFPRNGTRAQVLPTYTPVESDIRVMVNLPGVNPGVVNVSPDQLGDPNSPPEWYRQQHGKVILPGALLDDQVRISPRTRFDLYLRRDRVVMLVNGEQRLCNDFPSVALTMAEGALGFGQVLYHSALEHQDLAGTGQFQYLNNTPYADELVWDNLGYDENVPAPAGFDPTACFAYVR